MLRCSLYACGVLCGYCALPRKQVGAHITGLEVKKWPRRRWADVGALRVEESRLDDG